MITDHVHGIIRCIHFITKLRDGSEPLKNNNNNND